MFLTPKELLDILSIESGVLVYCKVRRDMRHAIGTPVPVVTSNGKPHFQIKGKTYNPRKLITALKTNNPALLYKTQSIRPLKPRELAMHSKLSEGLTLAEVGALYGLSRQRVKQIADKLAAQGHAVHPQTIRQTAAAATMTERIRTLHGGHYGAIQADPQLRKYLGARITSKRNHALAKGIEFSLTLSDFYPLPLVCPVLGIPLMYAGTIGGADNAMALDRIDPSKGYVPGNIVMVSQRANRIKNDATPEELRKIAAFYTALEAPKA
jgi:hypothetical protein